MEGLFFGKRLFESLLPLSFKIDGVDQEHDLLRVYFIYDLADFALGAGADPAVDRRHRLRVVEIERGDFGAVELPLARLSSAWFMPSILSARAIAFFVSPAAPL